MRELGAQQPELFRQKQYNTDVGGTAHTRRIKIFKVDISKYRRVEEDFLLLCCVELDRSINARRIDNEQRKLTFAPNHLAGRSITWALGMEMGDLYDCESLEAFKTRLEHLLEPPQDEFKARSELLKLKQG